MDITNNQGDLSVSSTTREYPVVEDGTWESEYKGYAPFKEDGMYGHKEGVRLRFKITKGPYLNQVVSFKGNMFQDPGTGKWFIGKKSALADVIRVITGSETLNKGHEGSRVFIITKVNTTKTGPNAGRRYTNVKMVLAMPKDYAATTTSQPAPVQQAPQPRPVQQPAPAAAKATQPPQPKNTELLDDLSELSDFKD